MNDKDTSDIKYSFHDSYEESILARLIRNKEFYDKCGSLVEIEYLESQIRRDILALVKGYYGKYSEPISRDILTNEILTFLQPRIDKAQKIEGGPELIRQEYNEVVGRLYLADISSGEGYTVEKITTFAKNQKFRGFVGKYVEKCQLAEDRHIDFSQEMAEEISGISQIGGKDKATFARGEGIGLFDAMTKKDEEPNHLISPWLVSGDKGFLTADKKVGKTNLQMDEAFHLAAGVDWLGFKIPRPVKVLHIRFELAWFRFNKRLRMMNHGLHKNIVKEPVFEFVRGFEITNQKDQDWLFKMIDKHEPELLILDPLYKMTTLNLSDPHDGPRIIRAFEKLGERHPDLSTQKAHHNKRRQSNQTKQQFDAGWESAYGVFQLFADMDYQISITSDGKDDPTFRWEFLSNDEPVDGFYFKRNPETLLHYRVDQTSKESDEWAEFNKEMVEFIVAFRRSKGLGIFPDRQDAIDAGISKRKLDSARKNKRNKGWKFWESIENNVTHIRFDIN